MFRCGKDGSTVHLRKSEDNEDSVYVTWNIFIWVVGFISGLTLASVGWAFASFEYARQAVDRVSQVELRLQKEDSNLETQLKTISLTLEWLKTRLEEHDSKTSNAPTSRK
jgi:uncharacterized membrane protein